MIINPSGCFVVSRLIFHSGVFAPRGPTCHTRRLPANKLSHSQMKAISVCMGPLMDCISLNMDVTNTVFIHSMEENKSVKAKEYEVLCLYVSGL